jgi:hypothetical protein
MQWSNLSVNEKETYIQLFKQNFILNKYGSNIIWRDIEKSNYSLFDSSVTYKDNDIVKVQNSTDSSYYDLYIKKAQFGSHLAPGNPESGWVKIDYTFDEGSTYLKDDIVMYVPQNNQGSLVYLKANQLIITQTNPYNDIWNSKVYWERLF